MQMPLNPFNFHFTFWNSFELLLSKRGNCQLVVCLVCNTQQKNFKLNYLNILFCRLVDGMSSSRPSNIRRRDGPWAWCRFDLSFNCLLTLRNGQGRVLLCRARRNSVPDELNLFGCKLGTIRMTTTEDRRICQNKNRMPMDFKRVEKEERKEWT